MTLCDSIYVDSGLLINADLLRSHVAGHQVFILTNQTVAPLYLSQIKKQFGDLQCDEFILPDGEEYKSLIYFQKIIEKLMINAHERSTTIIALGGGVVGDLAGFVASTYQRGVGFIQIPTSLLAQVDASIGGKTAINFMNTKNMVGSFYQPEAVYIDPSVLKTLPEREFRSGLAEVIKHALIADESYFIWLEENIEKILSLDLSSLQCMIRRSIEIKKSIVKQDETDHGVRQVLNFGHTIGHAIEAASHYELLHGEAVAIGMLTELVLTGFPGVALKRLAQLLLKAGFDIDELKKSCGLPGDIKKYLRSDKKRSAKKICLPVLLGIGRYRFDYFDQERMEQSLENSFVMGLSSSELPSSEKR